MGLACERSVECARLWGVETDVSFKGLDDVGEVYRVLLLVMVMVMVMVVVLLLLFCLLCRLLFDVLFGELFGVLRGDRWRSGRLWCATGPRSVAVLWRCRRHG